jgi:hypothetical protein
VENIQQLQPKQPKTQAKTTKQPKIQPTLKKFYKKPTTTIKEKESGRNPLFCLLGIFGKTGIKHGYNSLINELQISNMSSYSCYNSPPFHKL